MDSSRASPIASTTDFQIVAMVLLLLSLPMCGVAIIMPSNEYEAMGIEDTPDCDVVTGPFIVTSVAFELAALALFVVAYRRTRASTALIGMSLSAVAACLVATQIPAYVHAAYQQAIYCD